MGPIKKLKEEKDDGLIFVFYKYTDVYNEDTKKYKFGKLDVKYPSNWWMVGSGGTSNPEYPNESQFQGNKEDKQKMKEILIENYEKLVKWGIVQRYKIRFSYKP